MAVKSTEQFSTLFRRSKLVNFGGRLLRSIGHSTFSKFALASMKVRELAEVPLRSVKLKRFVVT